MCPIENTSPYRRQLPRSRRVVSRRIFTLTMGLLVARLASGAGISVPPGGSIDFGTATVDFGCAGLDVNGTAYGDGAILQGIGNVDIAAGGVLNGGSAQFNVSGDWSNAGIFAPGSSAVVFADDCLPVSLITGNNTFYDLTITSSTGETFQFLGGSTQTVTHVFTIISTGTPLTLASTTPGTPAYILPGSGAVFTTGGSVVSWVLFSPGKAVPVPLLSGIATALLAAALLWVGAGRLVGRQVA